MAKKQKQKQDPEEKKESTMVVMREGKGDDEKRERFKRAMNRVRRKGKRSKNNDSRRVQAKWG